MTAIEHINYRHSFDSGFHDVSRCAQGTSPRQIRDYVDRALRRGQVSKNGMTINYDLGRTIGTDANGKAATQIRVHVRNGQIQSAYPVIVMGDLLSILLTDECTEHVLRRIRDELSSGRNAYITLNRLNIRINREDSSVTIEDELDPDSEEVFELNEFSRLLSE